MGESAEDLLLADPAPSKVSRFGWPGADLSRGELAEGTVRPRCVVVPQVLVQHPAQMALIDDQQVVEELPAQGPRSSSRRWRSFWAPAAGFGES